MKIAKGAIARMLDEPAGDVRFYLFHGPDQAQSRALGARLVQALGADRFIIISNAIKSDPASLSDEAGALALFGGKRVIWVEPAGEDIADGVETLLGAPALESPVVAIAGHLRKTSGLLKLAESSPLAASYAAYLPEGQDAERMVVDLGRRFGLKLSPPVAARLADACGNDQAIAAQELDKLALYVGASQQSPKELDHDAVDAVGTETAGSDFLRLADLALSGRMDELLEELARLPAGGSEAIPVVRSLQRRLLMLAPARARIEKGERAPAVMASLGRTLFWRDKQALEMMLERWSAAAIAKAIERCAALERSLIFSDAPAVPALGEELIAVARAARRR
ncbi:MAG: DNA polymerase III subunit delta [Sphingomicrobium sp.]